MLKELGCHVFVDGVEQGKLQGNVQHGQAKEGHPCRAVGLLQLTPSGQGTGAVKDPNVVQPKEASGEDVLPTGILTVDPPGETRGEEPGQSSHRAAGH